ncbi:MAG TPA: APC family permease [Gaiellaceae bacterium]|jgi:amino acid transporter|nr:APC family permease [Gaiellaceae bacterium]
MEASAQGEGRGLRRNAVGLPGLIAQSLGVTAPEISAVVIAAVVASKIGGWAPSAFWVAGIGAVGLALVYGRFARYVPSAGGTYAIIRAGLGRDVGFFGGWTLLAVGIIFVPGLLIASAFLLQNFFGLVEPSHPFFSHAWWGWALLLTAIVAAISWLGIQISARVLLALTAVGVSMLLILDIIILAKGGAHGWAWSSLAPWNNHGTFGFGFFALGVGIAMTGFSGFETAVFLAEEAHTPKKQVPKAVLGAVALAVIFFIVTTFSITTGYGLQAAGQHWPSDSGGAVVGLSIQYASFWFGKLLLLFLAISSFASALGTANFTTRTAFAWGHDGYLPRVFGRTHPRFKSPDVAIGVLTAITLAVMLGGLLWQGRTVNDAVTFFSWLLQVGATGILPVYALVGIAGFVHARKYEGTLVDILVAPLLTVAVVVVAEVTEFYGQTGIYRWAPYVMLGWMGLGILVRLATRAKVEQQERQAEEMQPELAAG